jgi:hypothetical protein
MIETVYMEIIILLLLSYIIDKKILPQIIILFLTLAMLIHEISITTDIPSKIGVFVLFSSVMLYSAAQVSLKGSDEV